MMNESDNCRLHDRYKAALKAAKKSLNKKWIDKGKSHEDH